MIMGLRAKPLIAATSNNTGNAGTTAHRKSPGASHRSAMALLTSSKRNEKVLMQNGGQSPTEVDAKDQLANCITTTTTTTTTTMRAAGKGAYHPTANGSLFASAAVNYVRPQTLNVQHLHETPADQTQLFLGEVLSAWRAKARCNVVPADRTQELFHELSFHPSDKQISEMLQTAKYLARKGSRQPNGLTFGEFCVLAADLKRFRSSGSSNNAPPYLVDANNFNSDRPKLLNTSLQQQLLQQHQQQQQQHEQAPEQLARVEDQGALPAPGNVTTSLNQQNAMKDSQAVTSAAPASSCTPQEQLTPQQSPRKKNSDATPPVEVFLGGSCNPTTWRADVAIPALQQSGISFYNPQVSDWTPDLIELEHRAKEKARVLFFVMDSETRASAGAIEAAHIAGQNCKQLVLVLHPYRENQYILNEPISQQEYIDLTRNQLMLQELVTRRGLPVLNNIPSGLHRTKEILAGLQEPPSNIASILFTVRGAFDRVGPKKELITLEQCQRALSYLGYAQSLIKLENLQKIIATQRESLAALNTTNANATSGSVRSARNKKSLLNPTGKAPLAKALNSTKAATAAEATSPIDFNLFCVISAYLSVLQQEIHENGCISPIKGTNVPPPPIYLSNMQGDDSLMPTIHYASTTISRTSSNTSVPPSTSSSGISLSSGSCASTTDERCQQYVAELLHRSRDSGTSSPQPPEANGSGTTTAIPLSKRTGAAKTQIFVNVESIETTTEIRMTTQTLHTTATSKTSSGANTPDIPTPTPSSPIPIGAMTAEEESDSNDSVFSSSSSGSAAASNASLSFAGCDFRDVYLGGSCALRSRWRDEYVIPYLRSKNITFHKSTLHESRPPPPPPTPVTPQSPAATNSIASSAAEAILEHSAMATAETEAEITHEHSFTCTTICTCTRRTCPASGGGLPSSSPTIVSEDVEEEQSLRILEEKVIMPSLSLSPLAGKRLYNPALLDASRVLLFVITNETRSLAPMTLAAHCIGLMYNVVLSVQMLPEECVIGGEKLTVAAIKDYNRGRSYLIDLAKRQGVPVFNDLKAALECTVDKVQRSGGGCHAAEQALRED